MDAALQAIADKNQEYIRDKVNPDADPAKILAEDVADINDDIISVIDALNSRVIPTPAGVEWVTAPGAPTFGTGTISETASVLKVNGADRNVDAATLSQPLAATGMHRIDLTVVHYDPETLDAEYELIQGAEVANTETAVAPAIGADRVLVRTMLVKQSGAPILTPTFYANSASINGGASVFPDVTGKLNLPIDETNVPAIAANTTAISGNTTAIAANTAAITANTNALTLRYTIQALTDAGTIAWNMNSGHIATVTLGGNRSLSITNPATFGTIKVTQDATGSRTLALPAGSKVSNNGAGTITLSSTPGAIDVLTFFYDGTNYLWNYGPRYT